MAGDLGRRALVEGREAQHRLLADMHLVDVDRLDPALTTSGVSFGTTYITGSAARITPRSVSAVEP